MGVYLGFLLMCWSDATGGASVLVGAQRAHYWVAFGEQPLDIPNYSNNGFSQASRGFPHHLEMEVEVENQPLRSRIRAKNPQRMPSQLAELETQLRALKEGTLTDQVALVIHWLRNEIDFVSDGNGPEQVTQVLAVKRANCVGMANLAIFILKRLGVKARYVTGIAYRLDDDVKLLLRGNVLHRWIEVYYDDVGWVFSDPSGKINYVEATYVVLGVEHEHAVADILKSALGAQVELLSFENGFAPVQRIPGLDPRLGVRPNRLVAFPHP